MINCNCSRAPMLGFMGKLLLLVALAAGLQLGNCRPHG